MKGVCVFVHMLSALESGPAKRVGMLRHVALPNYAALPNDLALHLDVYG